MTNENGQSLQNIALQSKMVTINTFKPDFLDVSMFLINGVANKQHIRIWGVERQDDYNRWLWTVQVSWCGVHHQGTNLYPCFFENANVTTDRYQNMQTSFAFPRLTFLQENYIFQLKDALPQYSNRATVYLNNKRPSNWIGQDGAAAERARSPLDPLQFLFRWTYQIKDNCYTHRLYGSHENKIWSEICQIIQESPTNVWHNTKLQPNYIMV